jgi:type III secretory pathway component EscV
MRKAQANQAASTLLLVALFLLCVWLMTLAPRPAVEGFLACSLLASCGALLASVYAPAKSLASWLPTGMVVTSLLRLSLWVACTQLILLETGSLQLTDAFARLLAGFGLASDVAVLAGLAVATVLLVSLQQRRVAAVTWPKAFSAQQQSLAGAALFLTSQVKASVVSVVVSVVALFAIDAVRAPSDLLSNGLAQLAGLTLMMSLGAVLESVSAGLLASRIVHGDIR